MLHLAINFTGEVELGLGDVTVRAQRAYGVNISALPACRSAGSSPEPRRRAAALTVCAVLTEGCAEQLRKRLNQVRPVLLAPQQPLPPQQPLAACEVNVTFSCVPLASSMPILHACGCQWHRLTDDI